jgi:hypothetical protein
MAKLLFVVRLHVGKLNFIYEYYSLIMKFGDMKMFEVILMKILFK